MNYNFDEEIERRGTNSVKWDSRPDAPKDIIPLWVADMDFRAAPPILEALKKRVEKGVFGYTYVPTEYYDAIVNWFEKWHQWKIDRENVIYTPGVVPALSAIIKAMTKPGEKVLIQTPVYNCFFSSIKNNGCEVLENRLQLIGNHYEIDFDDLEEKAKDVNCRLMLLCNPHNPAGRVWTKDELKRINDICQRNNVLIVSDEIHCELVYKGHIYTPFATIASGDWVSCISPSKAFNIAGLQISNIVASSTVLKDKIDRAVNDNEVCDVNPFGVDALIAAYNQSRKWLESVISYIYDNYRLLKEEFARDASNFTIVNLEGTYLAWIDCRSLNIKSDELEEWLIENYHVWINAGSMYGEAGEGFVRVNLACPKTRLLEGIKRLISGLNDIKNRIGMNKQAN